MTEFVTFYERRASIKASPFYHISEAEGIVWRLEPSDDPCVEWTVRNFPPDFILEITLRSGRVITVERGDFIAAEGVGYVVIPWREFRDKWQLPEWKQDDREPVPAIRHRHDALRGQAPRRAGEALLG